MIVERKRNGMAYPTRTVLAAASVLSRIWVGINSAIEYVRREMNTSRLNLNPKILIGRGVFAGLMSDGKAI